MKLFGPTPASIINSITVVLHILYALHVENRCILLQTGAHQQIIQTQKLLNVQDSIHLSSQKAFLFSHDQDQSLTFRQFSSVGSSRSHGLQFRCPKTWRLHHWWRHQVKCLVMLVVLRRKNKAIIRLWARLSVVVAHWQSARVAIINLCDRFP